MLLLNGKLLEFLQFHLVTCSLPLMILSYAWFKFRFMVNIFFLTEVQYISKTPMYYTCRRWAVVEAREGNRVLPSACSSIFNNIKLSVHIFLKYKGGIPGASPIWATCWKGESAFSDLSSFQNLSLLIDSYHCLLVDAVSSGRGVFWGLFIIPSQLHFRIYFPQKERTPAPMLTALPRENSCQMSETGSFIDTHNLLEKY